MKMLVVFYLSLSLKVVLMPGPKSAANGHNFFHPKIQYHHQTTHQSKRDKRLGGNPIKETFVYKYVSIELKYRSLQLI